MDDAFKKYEEVMIKNALAITKARICREKLKSFLSVITAEYLAKDMSVSKAETLARADQRYQIFLLEAQKTIETAEITKSQLKKIEMEFDWERSKSALKRAEMNLL